MLRHMDASCIWTDEEHQRVYTAAGRQSCILPGWRINTEAAGLRICSNTAENWRQIPGCAASGVMWTSLAKNGKTDPYAL